MMLLLPLVLTLTSLVVGESRPRQAFVPAGRETIRRVTTETSVIVATPTKAKRRCGSSRHNLFFRSSDPSELAQQKVDKNNAIPSNVYSDLSSANVTLPYEFETRASQSVPDSVRLSIRLLRENDLPQIINMCVAEYGSEITLESLLESPTPNAIVDYLDVLSLRALVDLTIRMKLADPTSTALPSDHAVLVACQSDGNIVGMVEVSRQPPIGDRNPPPIPIPLWFKQLYSLAVGAGDTQGWCTNLLIAPPYRGRNYSKVLMAAVEGIARSWQCESVHLHADADSVNGLVPQRLYINLGYEMLKDEKQDISWMGSLSGSMSEGPATLSSSVFVIEGVPLLYLQKQL
jgi:GNAT superfamily N-acetyltransferase